MGSWAAWLWPNPDIDGLRYTYSGTRLTWLTNPGTDFSAQTTAVRLKLEWIQLVVGTDSIGTGVDARKGLLQGHLLEKSD